MNTFLTGKIIEISGEGYYLRKKRGFLAVDKDKNEVAAISFDDIQALIFNSYDLVYSNKIVSELAKRKIPVIFCNDKHMPTSLLVPFDGYFHQSRRILMQAQCSKPLNKRLWKEIVQAKIIQQALALEYLGKDGGYLVNLTKSVLSDDKTNCEAQAARYYFSKLFGENFARDRALDGINAMLNYGYIVYRSAIARAVISCGLNPSFGIKHRNPNNSMPLIDDLIEPFRPFIDIAVYKLVFTESVENLDKYAKKFLVDSIAQTIIVDEINTTPNQMMYKQIGRAHV